MSDVNIKDWEQAEVARSAAEASHIDNDLDLLCKEKEVIRYMDPPSTACYPLEYSYHLLGDIRGKAVLEYGCGDGLNTVVLARRGAELTSLDISSDLINVARRRLAINRIDSNVKFVVGSAHDLPVRDESVDVVFGMAILHHLDLEASSREVFRVLKKGGRAIFQEPIRNSKLIDFLRNLIPFRHADVSPFERPLTDLELERYADKFSTYNVKSFSLPFMNLMDVLKLHGQNYKRAAKVDRMILDNLPRLAHFASIKVFEMVK